MSKGFKVTVEDLDNGGSQSMIVQEGDYMLIPFAPCYLHHTQASANGTRVLTLKGHSPTGPARAVQQDAKEQRP